MSRVRGRMPGAERPLKLAFGSILLECGRLSTGRPELSRASMGSFEAPPVHLTQFSDYGLRLAIFLGCHPGRAVSVDEVEPGVSGSPVTTS